MDKKYVEGIWRAFLEVQEGKHSKEEELSPKQKKLDHDNDGDIDGSDLAKLRKHGPKEKYQKEDEGDKPYPTPKKVKKAGDELEDVKNRTSKLKEEDEEGAPYPSLDKKKREKPGSNLEVVKNRSDKLKESELFSARELEAIEERAETAGATASEPFMSTSSAGEKKFYADHQKSDKTFEDMEDEGEMDAVKAGKAGVTQSSKRRGDNLDNGDSKTPEKVKGQ